MPALRWCEFSHQCCDIVTGRCYMDTSCTNVVLRVETTPEFTPVQGHLSISLLRPSHFDLPRSSRLLWPSRQRVGSVGKHRSLPRTLTLTVLTTMVSGCRMLTAFVLVCLALVVDAQPPDGVCNICGCDGCFYATPQAAVRFEYQGVSRQFPCEQLQQMVANENTISRDFCENELPIYTRPACFCALPDGTLMIDIPAPSSNPTIAPTPSAGVPSAGPPSQPTDGSPTGAGSPTDGSPTGGSPTGGSPTGGSPTDGSPTGGGGGGGSGANAVLASVFPLAMCAVVAVVSLVALA